MKKIVLTLLFFVTTLTTFCQNVGIGVANPSYKLDVAGFVRNSNSTMTSPGLFGRLTAGGSLRIENSDNTKFLVMDGSSIQAQLGSLQSSGTSASALVINPYGGNVGIGISNPNATLSVARRNGTDGTAAFWGTDHVSHFNYSIDENTYIRAGKTSSQVFINDTHNGDVNIATGGGNINTGNSIYSSQTGGLNLVPLGIVKYSFSLDDNGNSNDVVISNEAGNLYTSWNLSTTRGADDKTTFTILLDFAQVSNYAKIIAVGSPEFDIYGYAIYKATSAINRTGNSASLVINYSGDCLTCQFAHLIASGTYMIYGIR